MVTLPWALYTPRLLFPKLSLGVADGCFPWVNGVWEFVPVMFGSSERAGLECSPLETETVPAPTAQPGAGARVIGNVGNCPQGTAKEHHWEVQGHTCTAGHWQKVEGLGYLVTLEDSE